MTPQERSNFSARVSGRIFSPWFILGFCVFTFLVLLLIFLPVKARVEDRLLTPSGYIRGDGYFDFKIIAKDKLTKK